jgi:hypothetical protein
MAKSIIIVTTIFIIGVDRSGTTILYRMLAYRPALCWFSQFSMRRSEIRGGPLVVENKKGVFSRYPKNQSGSGNESDRGGKFILKLFKKARLDVREANELSDHYSITPISQQV